MTPRPVTFHIQYVIDPRKIAEFERYARAWITVVERFGGTHHGYFLPGESTNDIAVALFTFSSLAAYEEYRVSCADDPDGRAALALADESRCFLRYDRTLLRPLPASG